MIILSVDQCCPICKGQSSTAKNSKYDGIYTECFKCGKFTISDEALEVLSDEQRIKVAAILFERTLKHGYRGRNKKLFICSEKPVEIPQEFEYPVVTIGELEEQFPKSISERLDRTLLNLTRLTQYPGAKINITDASRYYFFPESDESREVFFFMDQLVEDLYINGHPGYPSELIVTVKGWNRVDELQKNLKSESNQAFVAMWFSDEMNEPYEQGIKQAILETGFTPVRIDQKEHNNKIDDEIIAEIKNSKFLIADFSGHRGGVYFEAGFGMGLGIPVIWCCREDHLKDIHFDTRQYSHIVWSDAKDLKEKLYNRIRATIV